MADTIFALHTGNVNRVDTSRTHNTHSIADTNGTAEFSARERRERRQIIRALRAGQRYYELWGSTFQAHEPEFVRARRRWEAAGRIIRELEGPR